MEQSKTPLIAYKGFNTDMTCRGFQFAVGQTYKHDGAVKACASGFHACEYPLDCFAYYAPGVSVYAVVEAGGDIAKHDEDSKVACSSLAIKASIDLPGLIKAAIEYTFSRCKPIDPLSPASATGDQGAASATGEASIAVATGWYGKAKAWTGCAIVLVYRDDDGKIIHIRASKVGENGIKPDVFYTLSAGGEFVEVAA